MSKLFQLFGHAPATAAAICSAAQQWKRFQKEVLIIIYLIDYQQCDQKNRQMSIKVAKKWFH